MGGGFGGVGRISGGEERFMMYNEWWLEVKIGFGNLGMGLNKNMLSKMIKFL